MAITCNDGKRFGSKVEIDTIHYWAQLIAGCCKERTVDIVDQHLCWQDEGSAGITHILCWRIVFSIQACEIIETILIYNLNGITICIYIEAERLLRQLLQCIQDDAVGNAELAFAIAVSESDGTLDDVVTVACGDSHLAVGNLEQEIVKDRQRILAADHLSKHIELAAQC